MAKKILAVDDERHIVKLFQLTLERAGYEVVTAFSGKDALEKVELEKPDLLILDEEMPHMDGLEVLQSLRKNPVTRDLPVILVKQREGTMTMFRDAKGRRRFVGWFSETEYWFIKPFQQTELVSVVGRILSDQDGSEVDPDRPKPAPDAPAYPVSWWSRMQEVWRKLGF